jgi:hypothetical protein
MVADRPTTKYRGTATPFGLVTLLVDHFITLSHTATSATTDIRYLTPCIIDRRCALDMLCESVHLGGNRHEATVLPIGFLMHTSRHYILSPPFNNISGYNY